MYEVNERSYIFYLVALQMAYEVPVDILRKLLLLDDKVLGLALAEIPLAGCISGFNCFPGVIF